jgi:hypothetical protein
LQSRRFQAAFVAFVPALMVLAYTVFAPRLTVDGDHFWHLAAGQWMIDHRAILHNDPFSFTFAGAPWNAQEWLSEIIMAATYRAAGWGGLYVLFGAAFAATAYLLSRHLLKYLDPVPALFLCLFAIADIKGWVVMRPHVLVMPILVIWAGELLSARNEHRAPRWFLVPLMVLWVNLHASFLFGAALILPFAAEAVLEEKQRLRAALSWGAVFIGVLVAALANPAGLSGLLFPLTFTATPVTSLIPEWQASSFNGLGPFELSLLAGLFACLILGIRMPAIRLLLLVMMVHLTLAHTRFMIILAIVGALLLAEPMAKALKSRRWATTDDKDVRLPTAATVGAGLLSLCIGAAGFVLPRTIRNDDLSPIAALTHVPPALAQQAVFNDWLFGGYLIFIGEHPFIDGRVDMYGAEFVASYLRAAAGDREALERILSQFSVAWTILPPRSPANAILDALGWRVLYRDDAAVVHVHDAVAYGR